MNAHAKVLPIANIFKSIFWKKAPLTLHVAREKVAWEIFIKSWRGDVHEFLLSKPPLPLLQGTLSKSKTFYKMCV